MIEKLMEEIRNLLITGIKQNTGSAFGSFAGRAGTASNNLAQSPMDFNNEVFTMMQDISNTAVLPIAAVILAGVLSYELLSMLASYNNAHDIDMYMLYKWTIKAFLGVIILGNVFNIINFIFGLGAFAVTGGLRTITAIDFDGVLDNLETELDKTTIADIGWLIAAFINSLFVGLFMMIVNIAIQLVVIHRFIIIFLKMSVAPIPFATLVNKEWGTMGTNYIKSMWAVAFQGFFMMACIAIYGALIGAMGSASSVQEIVVKLWEMVGYGILLVVILLKTETLSKSIFGAT